MAERVAVPAEADFLLDTGPDPERGVHDAEAYRPALEAAFRHALPMLCVNPDRHVMVAQRLIAPGRWPTSTWRSGARCWRWGSPTLVRPGAGIDGPRTAGRVLAIGDTPQTDLAGAQAAGLDALWALTGLAAFAHGDSPSAETLREVALSEGVDPVAAVRGLRW